MTALTITRAHYEAAAAEATLLAALRNLECAARHEAVAREHGSADEIECAELVSLDARREVRRVMAEIGLNSDIVGSSLG